MEKAREISIYDTRLLVYGRDGWMCQRCGSPQNLTMAHKIGKGNVDWVIKYSRRHGLELTKTDAMQILNDPDNLVTACAGECNDFFNMAFKTVQAEHLLYMILRKQGWINDAEDKAL